MAVYICSVGLKSGYQQQNPVVQNCKKELYMNQIPDLLVSDCNHLHISKVRLMVCMVRWVVEFLDGVSKIIDTFVQKLAS